MVSRYLSLAGLVAALATATPANNLLLRTASDGLATRGGVELARRSPLRRVDDASSSDIKVERGLINLSKSFSIEGSLENEVLFDGYVNSARLSHGLGRPRLTHGFSHSGSLPFAAPPITVICTKCCTKGTVKATLNDDDSLLNPSLRFDLSGVEAFIELDVVLKTQTTFSLTLLRNPPGVLNFDTGIPGGPRAGVFFTLELIISASAAVDLNGGFFFKLPDTAFFEASLKDGVLTDLNL